MDKSKIRLGIYGGTFSPPHAGHVKAAEAFLCEAKLDKLLIMPTFVSPFKKDSSIISTEHRLRMAELAFSSLEGFGDRVIVSDYEASRQKVSYTANTLQHFAEENVELVFLCGTDMFLTLDKWYQAKDIFLLATIACMRRERSHEYDAPVAEAKARYERDFGARIIEINASPIEVSSTNLRALLEQDSDTNCLLSPTVKDYIKEHQLYHD